MLGGKVKAFWNCFAAVVWFALQAGAQPADISYQGQLIDASGELVTGAVNIQLRIYESETPTGGDETPLYIEDHLGVAVEGGVFHLLVGQGSVLVGSFGPELFDHSERYLELHVNGEAMEPRQVISAVPYAFQASHSTHSTSASVAALADDSARLGGLSLTEITSTIPTAWANGTGQVTTNEQVVIGSGGPPDPATELHVAGDVVIEGQLITGESGTDLEAQLAALAAQVDVLAAEAAYVRYVFTGEGVEMGVDQSWGRRLRVYVPSLDATVCMEQSSESACFRIPSPGYPCGLDTCQGDGFEDRMYFAEADCLGQAYLVSPNSPSPFPGDSIEPVDRWSDPPRALMRVSGSSLAQRMLPSCRYRDDPCQNQCETDPQYSFEVSDFEGVLPFARPIPGPLRIGPRP
ncbi:hypothetical protein MK489_05335 [Myxococcota bacterium]|nr:hypothetical protein [Myxococcota bacterium]